MSLKNFLKEYVADQPPYSHLDMSGRWGGKWNIPFGLNFHELYYEALQGGVKLCFTEVRTTRFRFFVDIDFKKADYKSLPTGFYLRLKELYLDAIKKLCPEVPEPQIIISVKNWYKVHFNFPNVIVTDQIAKNIREEVISQLPDLKLSDTWSKIIDVAIYDGSGLRMLGSVKKAEDLSAHYHIIIDFTENNEGIRRIPDTITLDDINNTSIRVACDDVALKKVTTGQKSPAKKLVKIQKKGVYRVDEETTKILTQIVDNNRHHFPEHRLNIGVCKGCHQTDSEIPSFFFMNTDDKHCPFIDKEHARTSCPIYMQLSQHGLCLKCHDGGCHGKTYPTIPVPISEADMKIIFKIENLTVNNVVNNTNNVIVNVESENVSNEDYLNINVAVFDDPSRDKMLKQCLSGNHQDITDLLYELHRSKYRFDEQDEWWIYQDHYWVSGTIALDKILADINKIADYLHTMCEIYNQSSTDQKKVKNNVLNTITQMINKIKNVQFKNSVVVNLGHMIREKHPLFGQRLDSNRYLLGFTNGVYDLKTMIFRTGLPEDCISITTGYEYTEKNDDTIKRELLNFLETIQPIESEREYMLKFLSTSLVGTNPEELFHIFSGASRNGKSKLRDLLKITLGNYFGTIQSNILTEYRPGTHAPQPDLMGLQGKRLIIASEPESSKKINTSFMKLITGNDPIKGRGLYEKNEREYVPQFKVVLLCNALPKLDCNDQSVWSRNRCLIFPVTFKQNPDQEDQFQKQIDYSISDKLIHWKSAFMCLLIEYYGKYLRDGLKPTETIIKNTLKYRTDEDVVLQYLTDQTEKGYLNTHLSTLHEDFNGWFRNQYLGQPLPSKKYFINLLRMHVTLERFRDHTGKIALGVKGLNIIAQDQAVQE